MLIKQAFAQDAAHDTSAVATPAIAPTPQTATTVAAVPSVGPPPSGTEMLLWNVGFVALMIVMFYLLLIRPQQSRYKEHATMLGQLKKGDKVVLQSGMIATIENIANDNQEMTVEFLAGSKAQVLKSAIAGKYEQIVKK